jgi:hypothetical protein
MPGDNIPSATHFVELPVSPWCALWLVTNAHGPIRKSHLREHNPADCSPKLLAGVHMSANSAEAKYSVDYAERQGGAFAADQAILKCPDPGQFTQCIVPNE